MSALVSTLGEGRRAEAADIPVPVQLGEHSEPRGQLGCEERDGLTWRYVPSGEGTRLGALYVVINASVGHTRMGRGGVPTALSRFRSHRSLIVHPAPRIIRAPVPNRAMYVRGTDGGALSA